MLQVVKLNDYTETCHSHKIHRNSFNMFNIKYGVGKVQQKTESSPLLSLSSPANTLLVHSSAVSGFGLVKAAAILIL